MNRRLVGILLLVTFAIGWLCGHIERTAQWETSLYEPAKSGVSPAATFIERTAQWETSLYEPAKSGVSPAATFKVEVVRDRSKPPPGWKILTDGERFRWQDPSGFIAPYVCTTKADCIKRAWGFRGGYGMAHYSDAKAEWKEVEE